MNVWSLLDIYIRSTYQLGDNTLLMDLNVPTGKLHFDLISDIVEACKKYFWTYKEDTYILEASRVNDLLDDPRIIQDYSFYLVGGYMPDGSPLLAYQLLFNFYHLAHMESLFFTPIHFLGGNKLC